MVPVLILAFSIVGLLQFALSYWRALLAGANAENISEEVLFAANINGKKVTSQDFKALASVHCLTPAGSSGLGFVGAYYSAVRCMARVASSLIPNAAAWADREMTACAQYLAVKIDQSLKASMALPENAGSY